MAKKNTYIQQLHFDGQTYTKGALVDVLGMYNIVAQEFPFVKNPEAKEIDTRDFAGSDGVEAYIPTRLPVKHYQIEVTFLYVNNGSAYEQSHVEGETYTEWLERQMRIDIDNFIGFLYGRNYGAIGSRLAIYNERIGMGRKDVSVAGVSNELYYVSEYDPDAVASFKIKFNVFDPTTEVYPAFSTVGGVQVVTSLNFE